MNTTTTPRTGAFASGESVRRYLGGGLSHRMTAVVVGVLFLTATVTGR
jgi:hypothetical protein